MLGYYQYFIFKTVQVYIVQTHTACKIKQILNAAASLTTFNIYVYVKWRKESNRESSDRLPIMFQMFHFILCTMLRKQICTLHRLVNANQQFDIVYIMDRETYWYHNETIISKTYKQCPLGVCVNVMITFMRNVEIEYIVSSVKLLWNKYSKNVIGERCK